MKPPRRHRHWLLAGGLAVAAAVQAEEPRWLTLQPPQASIGFEVESQSEETRSSAGGNSTYEHLALTPLLGLRTRGSIYHPNLLMFDLSGEAGWGWDTVSAKSSSLTLNRNDTQQLQRYIARVTLLATKPYNATFIASQDHVYRDYGTFNTYTVDDTRYGGRLNWNTPRLNLSADLGYREETAAGITSTTTLAETYFNFNAVDRRQSGQSMFFARYNEFENTLDSGSSQNSLSYSLGASDSETFGRNKNIIASTSLSYSHSEYSGQQTETITANENLTVHHRPRLDSYLSLDFSHSQSGSVSAARLQGSYGLRHQLYESLASQLEVHGSYDDSSSPGNTAVNDRYGVGIYENYTKRLSSWGRLTIGLGAVADHQDFNSTGTFLFLFDEVHNLTNPPVFLNSPRVVPGSVQVRAAGDGFVYTEGSDYTLIVVGELTQILPVLPVSSAVALHGSDVLVNYQSETLFNASFDSLNASAQIRLQCFDTFGLYARMNWIDHNAPPAVLTQTLTDFVFGADVAWRGFRAGAEYEDYDSNYSQYQAVRFYENYSCQPAPGQALGIDCLQTFYRYPDNRAQNQYQFLARYNLQLTAALIWNLEGGYTIQEVLDTEQLMSVARTGITWTRGKLSLRAGYEYNTQTTTTGLWSEERIRHRLYAHLKRNF